MNTHDLAFNWKLSAHEDLAVLTNKENLVAIMTTQGQFGDNQALLIQLSETEAHIGILPHYITSVNISINKDIIVEMSPILTESFDLLNEETTFETSIGDTFEED